MPVAGRGAGRSGEPRFPHLVKVPDVRGMGGFFSRKIIAVKFIGIMKLDKLMDNGYEWI